MIGEISCDQDLICGSTPELEYDNPYRQMILDSAGLNFPQGSSWQSFEILKISRLILVNLQWRKILIPSLKNYMICYKQLMQNYIPILPSLNLLLSPEC